MNINLKEEIEPYLKNLTKVQRKVLDDIMHDGCFILNDYDWDTQPVMYTPTFEKVQKVDRRTLCRLHENGHIKESLLGKNGQHGRIYTAFKAADHLLIQQMIQNVRCNDEIVKKEFIKSQSKKDS